MRIATWNVNGIRPRLAQVLRFLHEQQPHILCLQETKVEDALFPREAFAEAGYSQQVIVGQKAYHGVAILASVPIEPLPRQVFANLDDKRHAAVVTQDGIAIHNFYFPSGGAIPDAASNPKFAHKQAFFSEVTQWLKGQASHDKPLVMLGDFNVAPLENDVWNHKRLRRSIGHTDEECAWMRAMQATLNLADAPRLFVPPSEPLYSWWGYRFKESVAKDYGWRLDHAWLTPNLRDRLQRAEIIKATRIWDKPSDHVPVLIELT